MPQKTQNAEDEAFEQSMDETVEIVEEEELNAAEDDSEAEEMADAEASAEDSAEAPTEEDSDEELIMTLEDVRLVEAMLFASATALSEGQIAERFTPGRAKIIPDVLEHLREHYANRGVNLVQRDKRWALRTSTDLADNLRMEKEQPKKFTKAAMETMAVIAYHQPVTRAEIENIRGVATSPGALDALMEAGWIKPGKRREVPGRPVTWLTTQAFLDHFGLERLGDLPGMEDLKAAGMLDKRPAIEAMPTADMFDGEEGEDPQEVTDEDLIGKSAPDDEDSAGDDDQPRASHDADADDEDADFDNEDADGDDEDDDADASDDDDADDEDDFDDADDDSADDEDADEDASDDEDGEDDDDDNDDNDDDDDFDDEDDEDEDEEDED